MADSLSTPSIHFGAIVFLLDKNQLKGDMEHAGKAVGVHSGGSPGGDLANIGFKI
jgi:hypothetical protein